MERELSHHLAYKSALTRLQAIEELNLDSALACVDQESSLLIRYMQRVVVEYRQGAYSICPELILQKPSELKKNLHTLKGLLGTIGATRLYAYTKQLEQKCIQSKMQRSELLHLHDQVHLLFHQLELALHWLPHPDQIMPMDQEPLGESPSATGEWTALLRAVEHALPIESLTLLGQIQKKHPQLHLSRERQAIRHFDFTHAEELIRQRMESF